MRPPKEIPLDFSDLLKVISGLKEEAKSYRDIGMKKEANEIMKVRKTFQKVARSCKLSFLKIAY